jgi:hypothetical protein
LNAAHSITLETFAQAGRPTQSRDGFTNPKYEMKTGSERRPFR